MNALWLAVGLPVAVASLILAYVFIPQYVDRLKERRRHARIQKALLADPPWENPKRTDSSAGGLVYRRLLERLTMVEDRSTDDWYGVSVYWRDDQTGQLWHQVFREYGFNQVWQLDPVDRIPPDPNALPRDPARLP